MITRNLCILGMADDKKFIPRNFFLTFLSSVQGYAFLKLKCYYFMCGYVYVLCERATERERHRKIQTQSGGSEIKTKRQSLSGITALSFHYTIRRLVSGCLICATCTFGQLRYLTISEILWSCLIYCGFHIGFAISAAPNCIMMKSYK